MTPTTYSMSQGWSARSSSSSPWNAGILLDVPTIMNRYPPGLTHGAWRTSPASLSYTSSDKHITTGSKRPRSYGFVQNSSNRRTPPPPALSRLQPVPVAFPTDDGSLNDVGTFMDQDENDDYMLSNAIIYRSPNSRFSPSSASSRARPASQTYSQGGSSAAALSYPMRQVQSIEILVQQRAAADKEARLKAVASILLNRVGKPMRRRPRNVDSDGPRTYVRSGLGMCVSAAE